MMLSMNLWQSIGHLDIYTQSKIAHSNEAPISQADKLFSFHNYRMFYIPLPTNIYLFVYKMFHIFAVKNDNFSDVNLPLKWE